MTQDPREVCQSCKNPDTQRIIDRDLLMPFSEYHQGTPFKAFRCFCCQAVWHFKVDNPVSKVA